MDMEQAGGAGGAEVAQNGKVLRSSQTRTYPDISLHLVSY